MCHAIPSSVIPIWWHTSSKEHHIHSGHHILPWSRHKSYICHWTHHGIMILLLIHFYWIVYSVKATYNIVNLFLTQPLHIYFPNIFKTYPKLWKLVENCKNNLVPHQVNTCLIQNVSEGCQSCIYHCKQCDSHWSALFTQRSRLFLCVEINSSWRMSLSIASAVVSVNSGQLFAGMSMSAQNIT